MRPEDLACLKRIRQCFHGFILTAATRYKIRPEVLAGIIKRESDGRPEVLGDEGHGHGLMQIDDRSFPDFCATEDWKDPEKNISKGAAILRGMRNQVIKECEQFEVTATEAEIEQMAIAAYNCGADHPVHCQRHSMDLDFYTTGKDYSRSVLAFANEYRDIATHGALEVRAS